MRKKLTVKKKVILIVCLLVILLIGSFIGYVFKQINHVEINKSDDALGITTDNYIPSIKPVGKTSNDEVESKYDNQIINIALFGVDRRDEKERGRADSTMILTVDFKHNKLKLSSLMRDMYLDIEGHGETKFNHAYAYGGAPLAIKTINQTFETDIRDYVTVDFFTLEKIIDEIGGVEIDVKENEYLQINKYMIEVAKIQKEDIVNLEHAGLQTLSGKQAVSYARIRSVGNGDFERTERQRKVLSQMISKVQGMNKSELPSLVMKVLPYVETSLSPNTVIDMGLQYFTKGINELQQDRFPRDGYWESMRLSSGWYMKVNMEETKQQIHDFIYDKPEVSDHTEIKGIQEKLSE